MDQKYWSLMQDIIRCALANNPNNATTHQIKRLLNAFMADGKTTEAERLHELLTPKDPMEGMKIVRSAEDHGMCVEKGCKNPATTDYNGHGHWVCQRCDDSLNREFEDEYR